jgi:hypothetical protein
MKRIRACYHQLDHVDDTKTLKDTNPQLTHEEIENLNQSMKSRDTKLVITNCNKKTYTQKNIRLM